MQTNDIRGNTQNSYNPLASKQKQPNRVIESDNSPTNDSIIEISSSKENNLIKENVNNIANLNNYKAFLNVTKNKLNDLHTLIEDTTHNKDIAKTVKHTINSTYNGEKIFNQQINFSIDGTKDLYISTTIKQPNLESADSLNGLQANIQDILKDINDIEMIVDSKVAKEVDSMDYKEAKEKQEVEQDRIDNFAHQTQNFKDISDSGLVQKELLWLLR